jgi:hypothetical protein
MRRSLKLAGDTVWHLCFYHKCTDRAEGATAPETLRHNGPQAEINLESSQRLQADRLTDGVSCLYVELQLIKPTKSLRYRDRGA